MEEFIVTNKEKIQDILGDWWSGHKDFDILVENLNLLIGPPSVTEPFFKPQLIQGYTAEQWQEIKEGKYLCEFSGRNESRIEFLHYVGADELFQASDFSEWPNCRPAQIKGVMRPIFVEPVDKTGEFLFFDDCIRYVGSSNRLLAKSMTWDEIMKDCPVGLLTKYIEL